MKKYCVFYVFVDFFQESNKTLGLRSNNLCLILCSLKTGYTCISIFFSEFTDKRTKHLI